LLCPTISTDFKAKFHSLYVEQSGVGNFGKVGVGVGYFTSDSATLVSTSGVTYAWERAAR